MLLDDAGMMTVCLRAAPKAPVREAACLKRSTECEAGKKDGQLSQTISTKAPKLYECKTTRKE